MLSLLALLALQSPITFLLQKTPKLLINAGKANPLDGFLAFLTGETSSSVPWAGCASCYRSFPTSVSLVAIFVQNYKRLRSKMLGTFMQKGSHRFNLHPNHRKSSTHNSLFFSECVMRFCIWWPQHLIRFWESMSVQLDVGSSLFGSFKRTSLLSTSEKSCGLSLVQPHRNKQQLNWFATYERQKYRSTVIHSNQNQILWLVQVQ